MYYFFYLPFGTELRVRRFPVAVLSLAAINLLYFLLFHYSPEHARRAGALAFDTAHPTVITAFTACFLHTDWFHLLGNLTYLLTFGPALEERIRGPRFLLLYLVCGMGAMASQMGLNQAHLPGETGRLIMGASGAISGLLGLFLVRCGFARVKVAHVTMALVQGQSRAGTSRINGFIAIGFWILLQVVYGMISQRDGGVAYGSHLGGVVLGALFGVAMGLHRGAMTELVWTRSRRASEQGYWFAALGETLSYVKLAPDDTDGWLQLGRLYRILHRPAESVQAWQKAIDLLWRGRRRHEAVRAARELRHHYPLARIRPALLYRLGLHLERHGDLGWASHTFEDYARYYPGHQKAPEALIRAGDIEARLRDDLDRARKIYTEVVERYPNTREGQRARVELEMVTKIARNRCGEGEESRERAAS